MAYHLPTRLQRCRKQILARVHPRPHRPRLSKPYFNQCFIDYPYYKKFCDMYSATKIINFNANGLRRHLPVFTDFLHRESVDVCCLSETHLRANKSVSIPGYRVYATPRCSGSHGSTAVIMKTKHPASEEQNTSLIENTYVITKIGSRRLCKNSKRPITTPCSKTTISRRLSSVTSTLSTPYGTRTALIVNERCSSNTFAENNLQFTRRLSQQDFSAPVEAIHLR